MVLIGILTMFLAFFAYLLLAGAGLRRAFEVIARSALGGLGIAIFMAAVPYFFWPALGHAVFLHYAVLGCFVVLSTESLRRAREFVIPTSSTFEVVCLNVLAVSFGGPPDTVGFFEPFTEFGYFLLVDLCAFWVPEDLGWLKIALSLWPSALALWAASHGAQAGRLLRLVLMWWVQLISITWVFPASIGVLFGMAEGSRYLYIDAVLAAVGLVRVVMALLTLRTAVFGVQNDEEYGLPEGVTARTAFQGGLIDGMVVFSLPAWVYAAGGFGVYLLANVARHFLPPDVAITSGFFAILGASALVGVLIPGETDEPRTMATNPLLAIALLVAGLVVLREQPLLPSYVRVFAPSVAAAAQEVQPASPSSVQPVPEVPDVRGVRSDLNRLRSDTPVACEIANGDPLQLRCAAETWPLASLAHPLRVPVPVEVDAPFAKYTLKFLDFDVRCLELPVRVPDAEPLNIMLLVFQASASLPGQVGWVVGPEARCRYLSVAIFRDTPQGEPTIMFASSEQEAHGDPRWLQKVVTLQRHLQAEAEVGTSVDPDLAPAAPK